MVKRGRGVAIVFKEGLQLVKFDCSDKSANLECITCQTSINNRKYTMCSVYRPPFSSNAQSIDDWNALLSTLVICDGEIIICGDVNLSGVVVNKQELERSKTSVRYYFQNVSIKTQLHRVGRWHLPAVFATGIYR